jgi:sialate O-acetylesterase
MKRNILLATVFAASLLTSAALELGTPFAEHAVLQRQTPVPVWGWSKPGTEVTVEFAGQKQSAKAASDGKWTVTLAPLEASADPRPMTIAEKGGESRALTDILVGEVWMASGQSNMQWIAAKSSVKDIVKELADKGETPPIREFEVTTNYASLHPIEKATGSWKVNDYGNYSAVAFAFAHKLHQELGVPIGILNCSFSQTSIEAWIPREGFAGGTDSYTKSIHQKLLETDPATPEHKAAWNTFYQSLEDAMKMNAELVAAGKEPLPVSTVTPGNMGDNRDPSWMFNGRLSPVIPYAIRGAIWNQGYANMNKGLQYYVNLHSLICGWRLKWDNPELPVYFHQFYCPGNLAQSTDFTPSIGSTAEMRLGTWLARDIPHTGMSSQIDIDGAIHYSQKTIPGQRFALHALKNEYGKKDIVADGPMFSSYTVQGDKLIVEFDHAEGGLMVATQGKAGTEGEAAVNHFHLAGEDRVWHPATVKIDGSKAVVTSPAVNAPRGVSYGTGGIGPRPALYNKSLLPATPFISYDHKLVTSDTWPDKPMKIAGIEPDMSTVGLVYEYRKMPLLRSQFRNDAILQADMPITISGACVLPYGPVVTGKAEVRFSFEGTKETIPVLPGMKEWSITVPAMPASKEPKTLLVSFHIDGELVHERRCENILIGDVWYVTHLAEKKMPVSTMENSGQPVRVLRRNAKRTSAPIPQPYMVSVSTDPENRFASTWGDATTDLAAAIGHRLAKQSGRPTGIIYMTGEDLPLSSWIPFKDLNKTPSLEADYANLAQIQPGNKYYDANIRRYIGAWKTYWGEYIPQMIATRASPDGAKWGSYPKLAAEVTSKAGEAHNVLACSFIPGAYKGILFCTTPAMAAEGQVGNFGAQLSTLANSLIPDFGGKAKFYYTMPCKELAPGITSPKEIKGDHQAIEIKDWKDFSPVLEAISR